MARRVASGRDLCSRAVGGIDGGAGGDDAAESLLFRAMLQLFSLYQLAGVAIVVGDCGDGLRQSAIWRHTRSGLLDNAGYQRRCLAAESRRTMGRIAACGGNGEVHITYRCGWALCVDSGRLHRNTIRIQQ